MFPILHPLALSAVRLNQSVTELILRTLRFCCLLPPYKSLLHCSVCYAALGVVSFRMLDVMIYPRRSSANLFPSHSLSHSARLAYPCLTRVFAVLTKYWT